MDPLAQETHILDFQVLHCNPPDGLLRCLASNDKSPEAGFAIP